MKVVSSLSHLVHKSFWLTGIIAVVVVATVVGSVVVLGRSDADVFDGTTAPGSHEWWDAKGSAEADFCNQCHSLIATETAATATAGTHGNVTSCMDCHAATGPSGHVALPTVCADHHSGPASDLTTDAHAGFLADLGETEATASWACKACHTKVDVDIATTLRGPLALTQEP